MNSTPLFLDVNIPMYAAGSEHAYREACIWVLTEIAESRLQVAIDTEIVQEVLYRYGALKQWSLAIRMTTHLLSLVPVVYPITLADVHVAVDLFATYAPRGVRPRDIFHAAVMQNNGLTHIISTDKHFELIAGITRLDPQLLHTQAV